ncbi:MAG: putative tail fiber protein [Burkholderiaceae bacterium]|nr:putative tail fiber protein [Burkholderiaceae bacterium]
MPVPNNITELDTTPSMNSPKGAESVKGVVDDYFRAHAAFIAKLNNEKAAKSAIGSVRGVSSFNANATLTLDDVGKLISFYGSTSARVLTLPLASTVSDGTGYWFINQASVPVQISCGGTDTLNINTLSGAASSAGITILAGDSIFVASNGASRWNVFGWSSNNQFPASLAGNGYQKLPSGRIEVHGYFVASSTPGAAVSVTFPLSGTNLRNLQLTPNSSGTAAISAWFDTPTGTGFNGHCSVAGATVHYRAILD